MQQIKIVEPYRLQIKRQVRLEFSADTLSRLLKSGEVTACNFRCLDHDSKQCVRQLLLACLAHSPLQQGGLCSQARCLKKALNSSELSPQY